MQLQMQNMGLVGLFEQSDHGVAKRESSTCHADRDEKDKGRAAAKLVCKESRVSGYPNGVWNSC